MNMVFKLCSKKGDTKEILNKINVVAPTLGFDTEVAL